MSKATFQAGLAAGIVSGMRFPMVVERPPVLDGYYSYNGFVLPELPEWAESDYPYAVVWVDATRIEFWAFNYPVRFDPDTGKLTTTAGAKYILSYRYFTSANTWRDFSGGTTSNGHIATFGLTYQLAWANHDVLTPSGTVYLLGCGNPEPVTRPASRLYNGVKLPVLPDWDRGAYPYAFIQSLSSGRYCNLTLLSTPARIIEYPYFDSGVALKWDSPTYVTHSTNAEKTLWSWGTTANSPNQSSPAGLLWANSDILGPDGTVYLPGDNAYAPT